MSWKNHKKWHDGKDKELEEGKPVARPAAPALEPEVTKRIMEFYPPRRVKPEK